MSDAEWWHNLVMFAVGGVMGAGIVLFYWWQHEKAWHRKMSEPPRYTWMSSEQPEYSDGPRLVPYPPTSPGLDDLPRYTLDELLDAFGEDEEGEG